MGVSKCQPPSSEPDYKCVFDTLADPLFVLEVSHADAIRIVAANEACQSFFGVPAAQCIDRFLAEVLPAPAALRLTAECDRCKAAARPVEFRLETQAMVGATFDVKLNVIQANDQSVRITAVARAASVRSGPEADPNTEQFRVIAEYAADYISRCDRDGRILYLNPAVEQLAGRKYESVVGRSPKEWAADDPQVWQYHECIRRVIDTGTPQTIELQLRSPSGQTIYHQICYAPEWAANGEVRSIIGIGRDITRLRAAEAELRKLNATLEERVEARTLDLARANLDLSGFASTVSHDLRAPLRAIIGYLDVIAQDEGGRLSDSGIAMLRRISSAATRLDRLINAILAYSQAGQSALSGELVAMDCLAREVGEELIPHSSSVRIDVADLPPAHCDATMARQIWQNLIGNAIKFSAGSEQPRIEIGWFEQDDVVIYYVRDNGVGFDMKYADKLCSMFQRLHREDEFPGCGVGLAIVKRLVERHGGSIWPEGRPAEGATFYFTLNPTPRAGHRPLAANGSSLS